MWEQFKNIWLLVKLIFAGCIIIALLKAGCSGGSRSATESTLVSSYSPPQSVSPNDGVRCDTQNGIQVVTLSLDTMTWALNGNARALVGKNGWRDGKTVFDPPRLMQLVEQGLKLCGTGLSEPMVAAPVAFSATQPTAAVAMEKSEITAAEKASSTRPMTADSLIMAANDGDVDFIRQWIATGQSVNVRNSWESTPISAAAASAHCDILDILLAHGGIADPKGIKVGFTPLYFAAHKGNAQCVASLIKKKVRLNVRNVRNGDTALIAASYMGNFEAAKLLVDAGASLNITNGDGDTAYRAALAFGNHAIASYIQSKGGY